MTLRFIPCRMVRRLFGLFAVFLLPQRGAYAQREARKGPVIGPETEDGPVQDGGSLASAISNSVRQLLAEYTGRGPTRGRTSIRDNLVVVLLEDTLTKGERRLVNKGRDIRVLDDRAEFQAAMREDAIARIKELTGRKVTAFMSANHIDPDLAAELFVLEPDGEAASRDGR